MKKNIVLFVLFVLPIVAYLFFASGVNSFTTLPIITPKVADFGNWNSLNGKKISLDKKITVLGFSGTNILENRGNYFNLNEKIYKRYNGFEDLQFVVLCPTGTEAEAQKIVDALSPFTDVKNWNFVFASKEDIQKFYDGLHLKEKLNENLGTSNVYIIDKERNLRGRKDPKEYKEGYDTFHPSELSNEMLDDFKIILYEYRAALKKNHNATKQL
ncbi:MULTISPECIES: hypothetical protein [Flavobacterium]|uniref:hypothetical protein n=1 Tax=Flavobacterium TaxID=237 RepID=UPI00027305CA|nr:hypothetical protein [Flavobacterium sp. F52]EJG00291.1 hypothetical protein FF52_16699 [Flavobacterium sp. F52]